MRILSIDYGTKRTGLAVTDPLKLIASGLTTAEEAVEAFVIGLPKRLNNEDSAVEADIQQLVTKLKERFPTIKIHRYDERFTSKIAFQTMIDSGLKKKQRQNKALIDEISATLILQDFLNLAN